MTKHAAASIILGIDVSKEWVDAHLLPGGQAWHVANDPRELADWAGQLPDEVALAVLEATGGLETQAATALGLAGVPVAIVNPKQVKAFAVAIGQKAKSDAIDAETIARFGEKIQPKARPLPDKEQAELKELLARRQQLVSDRTAELNRLGTMNSKRAQKSIKAHIQWLDKQIQRIDQELDDTIKKSPLWLAKEQLLKSIPGIGPQTARTMLACMPELGQLNRKEIAALAGLAPYTRESGKWKGKRFIGGGRSEVRAVLYMAALSSSRANSPFSMFYRSLVEKGKPKKVALTACMRKMLTVMNAVIRDQKQWSRCH